MKHQHRRDRFFNECLKLIHEKGFRATTMRDIAERLDFEVANIYNYIDSKNALLQKYLFDISAEFHQGIQLILESAMLPEAKIRAVISLHIRLTSERPYQVALLTNEWRNLKPHDQEKFLQERAWYESQVKCILKMGITSGHFRSLNVEVATFSILGSIRWLFDWYTDHSKEMEPKDLENQISNMILNGLMR